MKLFVMAAVLMFPALALAASSPEGVSGLVEMVKAGKWGMAVGLALVLLTKAVKWGAVSLEREIPKNWQPWIAALLGVVGSVGVALAAGIVWWEAVLAGLFVGSSAAGLWSLAIKHLSRKEKP